MNGLCITCRNYNGDVLFTCMRWDIMEISTLLFGLKVTIEKSLPNLVVEGDSQDIAKLLSSTTSNMSELRLIYR